MKQPVVGVVADSQDERKRPLLDTLVPQPAYGNDTAIDFAQFGQTAIPEGKLFTAEFAKRVYDSVWKSSTLRSDRQNLSNNSELCLWLKSQMESLDIKNQDGITGFLKTFDATVKG